MTVLRFLSTSLVKEVLKNRLHKRLIPAAHVTGSIHTIARFGFFSIGPYLE